jgi:hypothetical protein
MHDQYRQIQGLQSGVDRRQLARLAADFADGVAQVSGQQRLGDPAQGHQSVRGTAALAKKRRKQDKTRRPRLRWRGGGHPGGDWAAERLAYQHNPAVRADLEQRAQGQGLIGDARNSFARLALSESRAVDHDDFPSLRRRG